MIAVLIVLIFCTTHVTTEWLWRNQSRAETRGETPVAQSPRWKTRRR